MPSNRRQLAMLAGLVLVLAVVLWWQSRQQVALPSMPAGAPAAPVSPPEAGVAGTGGPPAASIRRSAASVPEVALARLERERPGVDDTGRDPFRFDARPRPTAAPADSDRANEVPGGQGRPSPPAAAAAGGDAGGPAPPPAITLKFIGIVKRSQAGVVLAVLSDGKGVYYGEEGDVIEGRYRIVKIGSESIEMAYLDGRGQQRIPLTGA